MSVIYEVKENIALVTLNRPEVRNALNTETMSKVIESLNLAKEDEQVRVVVVRSAGDKAFCAGADLDELLKKKDEANIMELRSFLQHFVNVIRALNDIGKPTIASVQGYALAGGCGLAVACDLTIAGEKARFGVPEINVGFWGMIITAPIFRAVGMKSGLEMLYTGRQIDAHEARRIGLVNRVVPNEDLENEVMGLARELASKSPIAMKLGRDAFLTTRDMEYTKALKYLSEIVVLLASTDDMREGISAFREKRDPQWKGK